MSSIILLKLILAIVTPLGNDYTLYMTQVILNGTDVPWSPWLTIAHSIYMFWLWLPISHGNVPGALVSEPNYLGLGGYLLTALIKLPLIICDAAVGVLVYLLALRSRFSVSSAQYAAVLWLANPLNTLFGEMWGSVEVIPVALSLAAIALIILGHFRLSCVSLFTGIAFKLSPIIAWLALVAWLQRKPRSEIGRLDRLLIYVSGPAGVLAYSYWLIQGHLTNILNLLQFFDPGYSGFAIPYSPVIQTLNEYFVPQTYVGLAMLGVTMFYVLAGKIWSRDSWSLVPLALSGFLLVYALSDPYPTSFLWIGPLIALWNAKYGKLNWTVLLYMIIGVFCTLFYIDVLISRSSLLFIPINIFPTAPSESQQINILESNVLLFSNIFGQWIRSALSGMSLAYSMMVSWICIRKGRV
ncbi:MAG: hypothetical protein ABSF00_06445 [Candidatus Bathyarchaeia archaeon]